MFVLTLDQIGSRRDDDRVPALLDHCVRYDMTRAFERTVGDEVQGVTDDATTARTIVLDIIRTEHWHIGIGSGQAELGTTARAGAGPAYVNAREAVDQAKSVTRFLPSIAIVGPNAAASGEAQALLRLLGSAIRSRTHAQWEAIDAHREGQSISDIAARLDISVEAVSQRRGFGGQVIEEACWPLVDRLLTETDT